MRVALRAEGPNAVGDERLFVVRRNDDGDPRSGLATSRGERTVEERGDGESELIQREGRDRCAGEDDDDRYCVTLCPWAGLVTRR